MKTPLAMAVAVACLNLSRAQVNSGSNGSDGAFNPTMSTVINMADHPDGIYHYTSVNIPNGVGVSFIPNPNNTPVVWLVQGNVVINGTIDTSGQHAGNVPGSGGPGGFGGGTAGAAATGGYGPGGGSAGNSAGNGSYGTAGESEGVDGPIYGNNYLIPLIGGSGGGGNTSSGSFGGGGGGAILIAAQTIHVAGIIYSYGGNGAGFGGAGSGGAIRLVAARLTGAGLLHADGGVGGRNGPGASGRGGRGRIRFDTYQNEFAGQIIGVFTQGSQFVILPTAGQGAQLTITSIGGVPVSSSPTGVISTPDAVLAAQQNNPIPVVVRCSNIPLSTQITVTVKPVNGAAVSAMGLNNSGTLASSTATVNINMPRGGGLIYATASTSN